MVFQWGGLLDADEIRGRNANRTNNSNANCFSLSKVMRWPKLWQLSVDGPLGDQSILWRSVCKCAWICVASFYLFVYLYPFSQSYTQIYSFIHVRTFDYLIVCTAHSHTRTRATVVVCECECVCCTMCHLINQSMMPLFSSGNFIIIHSVLSHR